jgi:hypothetical protein
MFVVKEIRAINRTLVYGSVAWIVESVPVLHLGILFNTAYQWPYSQSPRAHLAAFWVSYESAHPGYGKSRLLNVVGKALRTNMGED